ncbi:hypothetical protein C8A05DRAFT_31742 [Staphylotrichum tortipilum]|uniref:F-box domain-containing protein n=1 Tax=Staphylotrichum tortipilum TaxID=2831512 RepID=A0AAN6MP15_9PEZI|nr:hypothetical protein C8A05DRAFT_31742 [Staphylotrichum longicolle]
MGQPTQDDPAAGDQAPTPSLSFLLEGLPAELRDQILLSVPDLATLCALVHVSPVMHAQYMANRDNLLRACVDRELDGLYVHA